MFQHLMVYSNYYKIKKSFNLRLYSDSFEPILLSIEISSNWFAEQNDFQIRLFISGKFRFRRVKFNSPLFPLFEICQKLFFSFQLF